MHGEAGQARWYTDRTPAGWLDDVVADDLEVWLADGCWMFSLDPVKKLSRHITWSPRSMR